MTNNLKIVFFLGLLTGILMLLGGVFGGRSGMILALVIAGAMNFGAYWFSDRIVLKLYRARELPENEAPRIRTIVRELSQKINIPMPKIYVIDQESPNAFATGRGPGHAAIALTKGIMEMMREEELQGVIAHELSHVLNRDTLISAIAATLAGAVMFLAHQMRWLAFFGGRDDDDNGGIIGLLVMTILAPFAAMLIQMAVSRSREYKADASAAQMTHNPGGLAAALEKLEDFSKKIPLPATPQTAHLFVVSPLTGKGLFNLFSTHPPIAERVNRLREMRLV